MIVVIPRQLQLQKERMTASTGFDSILDHMSALLAFMCQPNL